MICERYPNKDKRGVLDGLIITRRYIIIIIRREQLFIFSKHKGFGDHELHCVQKWFIVIREGIKTQVFEDTEKKEEGGGVLQSNTMPVRNIFMQLLERIYMLF